MRFQLKPVFEWDIDYIKNLPFTSEPDYLDFKSGKILGKDTKKFTEHCSEYLSAFANYEGGYLVLGVEDPKLGVDMDFGSGADLNHKNGLKGWLEQVLPPSIDPILPKIEIHPIPFEHDKTHGVIVIHIPSSDQAPHQATYNRKFYNRIGSTCNAIPTRMILDIANRAKHPDVSVSAKIELYLYDDPNRSHLELSFHNRSNVLCLHYGVSIKMPAAFRFLGMLFQNNEIIHINETFHCELSVNYSSPLFPNSIVKQKIPLKVNPSGKQFSNTIESIEIRLWADAAKYKDYSFPLENHAIIIDSITNCVVYPNGEL